MADRATEIHDSFWRFHEGNPHVYHEFSRLAFEWADAGHRHGSAYHIFEVLRWNHGIRTQGEPFEMNNNYRPHYARLWERENPSRAGFFRRRTSGADQFFAEPSIEEMLA